MMTSEVALGMLETYRSTRVLEDSVAKPIA
jgi:hypothetical protein